MIDLLNKINGWVQSGPAGNNLYQEDYDWEDLITWGMEGDIAGLVFETGFVDDMDAAGEFAENWGQYVETYDPAGEKHTLKSFQADVSTKQQEAYSNLWGAYSAGSQTGFGASYGAKHEVDKTLSNTSAVMSVARQAKDKAIYDRRDDWVDGLWDTMAMLADLGAFGEDD